MKNRTTSIFEEQIHFILQNLSITSNQSFTVKGKEIVVYPQQAYTTTGHDLGNFGKNTNYTSKEARQNLTNALVNQLYSTFYCDHQEPEYPIPPLAERATFMDQLSAANQTPEGWDSYWQVYHIGSNGQAFAQKKGVLRPLLPNTYQLHGAQPTANHPQQPVLNQYVHFYRQKENRQAQPVFYHVFAKEYLSTEGTLGRIYWNIQPEGATTLLAETTQQLNQYNIPFSFKCLNHPALYKRADAAVLYFDLKHLAILKLLLPSIVAKVSPYLQETLPLFTQQLYKGVAFAEDPGGGQSFGMSRAQALAEALVEAFQQSIKEEKALLEFVLTYLETLGIDRKNMHLNPRLQPSQSNHHAE